MRSLTSAVPLIILLALHSSAEPADDIEQRLIPAGEFQLGCSVGDINCDADEGKPGGVTVKVPSFYIDVHETSVAEYRQCVEAGHCDVPFDYRRTRYCSYGAPGRDSYPVNCVNWQLAYRYCAWRGGRLAFEVEWERAARGGTATPHPWGHEAADCSRAVMDPGLPHERNFQTDGCWRDLSWPRGQFEPNPFGLYDMLGGLSEWTMDWYRQDAYATVQAKGLLTGPNTGDRKAIKGGAWDEKYLSQRVSNRFAKPVTGNPDLYGSNGIRCVTATDESLMPQPQHLPSTK